MRILKKKTRPPKPVGFFLYEKQKIDFLHEKLENRPTYADFEKKISTPNFTKFLNP